MSHNITGNMAEMPAAILFLYLQYKTNCGGILLKSTVHVCVVVFSLLLEISNLPGSRCVLTAPWLEGSGVQAPNLLTCLHCWFHTLQLNESITSLMNLISLAGKIV